MNWIKKFFKKKETVLNENVLPEVSISENSPFNVDDAMHISNSDIVSLIDSTMIITEISIIDDKIFIHSNVRLYYYWWVGYITKKPLNDEQFAIFYLKKDTLKDISDSLYNSFLNKIEDDMRDSIENITNNRLTYR